VAEKKQLANLLAKCSVGHRSLLFLLNVRVNVLV